MRLSIRVKLGRFTHFYMCSTTQKLDGIVSKIATDKHIILLDLEKCNYTQTLDELERLQDKYNLGEIHVLTDKKDSFRAFCFTTVSLKKLLQILLDCKYLDYNFFYWTVLRSHATLRISAKENRPDQILFTIPGKKEKIPKSIIWKEYETGIQKRGVVLKNE